MKFLRQIAKLGIFAGLFVAKAQASTVIFDSHKSDLEQLKSAVEMLYSTDCPKPKLMLNGSWSINLKRCLPDNIKKLLTKKPSFDGPNCFNFSFLSIGLQTSVRPIDREELRSKYFAYSDAPDQSTSLCKEVKGGPVLPGDIILVSKPNRNKDSSPFIVHAFVHLTDKYVFNKTGPDLNYRWAIAERKNVTNYFMPEGSDNFIQHFRCERNALETPSILDQGLDALIAIEDFSSFMSNAFLMRSSRRRINSLSLQMLDIVQQLNSKLSSSLNEQLRYLVLNSGITRVRNALDDIPGFQYLVTHLHETAFYSGNDTKTMGNIELLKIEYMKLLNTLIEAGAEPEKSYWYFEIGQETPEAFCESVNFELPICRNDPGYLVP